MSYQVIARKYRPQRFEDVVGQEHVTQTLANAIRQGRIAHAYLFCGPRGTGKTTIARIFAKCLNCTGGPKVEFAEEDPRCVEIAEGRSLDVLEIDGASNNGVEQVRDLRETVRYAPASSKFKIYIIDEVHMLTVAAFNALLKTLEEPPAHVKFLFATTDPEKVLPTILSRCQRFDLRRIAAAAIVGHLAKIALAEGVQVDDGALYAMARGADGGLRDAESTLDQLISLCGTQIGESDVLSMFGLASRGQVLTMSDAVLGGETGVVLRELEGLARGGKDLGRLLTDLLCHFRNLLVYQVSKGDLGLLEISEAEASALADQAKRCGPDAVARVLEVLSEAESRFGDAVSKKIALEVTLWRAIQARTAVSVDAVLERLAELRSEGAAATEMRSGRETGSGGRSSAMPAAVSTSIAPAPVAVAGANSAGQPASSPAAVVAGGGVKVRASTGALTGADLTVGKASKAVLEEGSVVGGTGAVGEQPAAGGEMDLEALWGQLVEAVGRVSPFTKSYLLKARPVSREKGVLTIGFDLEFASYVPLVDNPKNHTLLQTKLKELGLGETRTKFVEVKTPAVRGAGTGTPGPIGEPRVAVSTGATAGLATGAALALVSAPAPVATNAGPAFGTSADAPVATAAGGKGEPLKPAAGGKSGSAAAGKGGVEEGKTEKMKPTRLDPAEFKNDPLIRDALEIFRGEIVEVRA
jgi:DNA polymerase-3 subunit gamma/tau